MSMRYKGGVISATPPTVTTSAAKGVWTLQQQLVYQAAGTWPLALQPFFVYETLASSTTWTCPSGVSSIDILVVAGGGGSTGEYPGSAQGGGGGGGGGVIYATGLSVTAGTSGKLVMLVVILFLALAQLLLKVAVAAGSIVMAAKEVLVVGLGRVIRGITILGVPQTPELLAAVRFTGLLEVIPRGL